MDLTASIRLKLDRLRTAKTARFNALSSAIEQEVASLTHQSADLFTKLEDALEADVLDDNALDGEMEMDRDLEKEEEEAEDDVDEPVHEQKTLEREVYDVIGDEEKEAKNETEYDYYYGRSREKSQTPSIAANPPPTKQGDATTINSLIIKKPSDTSSSVADLRSRAQTTQTILAERHASLVQLRQKHDLAMKRLNRLQADLEKVSQKWEAEECARLQSESVSVLGKRKRDAEDAGEVERREGWKRWGFKTVEWGLVFGFGVVGGTVAMSQFRQY